MQEVQNAQRIHTSVHVNIHTHTPPYIVSRQSQQLFIPHEFAYLNKSVLERSHGYSTPDSHNHFVLKKRPQASVQLRNEMLQRGVCGQKREREREMCVCVCVCVREREREKKEDEQERERCVCV